MISSFDVNVNCAYCFDDVVAALLAMPAVSEVRGSVAEGCVAVIHDTDESQLSAIISQIGHRVTVADNGEVVQDQARAVPGHICGMAH